VQVAEEAQCKALVLTHFSQRYPKVAALPDVCGGRTAAAFDMMTVDCRRLEHAAAVLQVLQELFKDDVGMDDPDTELASVTVPAHTHETMAPQRAHG
jgi:ribonuclease BN (tRNA processing enzyme)